MTTLARGLGLSLGKSLGNILGADTGTPNWTPTTPSQTLLEWQKADAGIVAANGAQFSPWSDQSGNSKDMVQATGSLQPVYNTNSLNGLPVVSFTKASSEYMSSGLSAASLSALTIAWVMRPKDMSGLQGYWSWAGGLTNSTPFLLCAYLDASHLRFYVNGAYNITNIAQAVNTANAYILTWTGAAWTLYKDGVSVGTYAGGGANKSTASGLYLGNGFGGYSSVDFAEQMVYGGAIGASDITSMSSYFRSRWGTP